MVKNMVWIAVIAFILAVVVPVGAVTARDFVSMVGQTVDAPRPQCPPDC